MTKYLKGVRKGDRVIRAFGDKRCYAEVSEISPTYIALKGYNYDRYRVSDGVLTVGTGRSKKVYEDQFLVSNPTQLDYELAEKSDLVFGIALRSTREKLASLDLETLRKLANILY